MKESFSKEKNWILGRLSILGPDTWTGLRIPLFLSASFFLSVGSYWVAFICVAAGILTDVIDGAVARYLEIQGRLFGCIFDAVVDRCIWVPTFYLSSPFIPIQFFLGYCILDAFLIPTARVAIGNKRENIAVHLIVGKVKFFMNFSLFYVLWMAKYIFTNWYYWPLTVNFLFSAMIILSVAEATRWEDNFQ